MARSDQIDPVVAAREVHQREADMVKNLTNREMVTDVLAPEFWETNHKGKKITRAALIERLMAGRMIVDEFPVDDTEVRVYGNVAISTGRYVLRGRSRLEDGAEQPFTREARFMHVWVHRNRRWQTVYGQHSSVAGA